MLKFVKVPKDFECSITHEIMIDPVFTADGETYDREAISEWLKKHDTSPNTNEKLEHTNLVPNKKLKSQISEFIEQNRKIFEQELIEAARQGDIEIVHLALKLGIKIEIQDANGWTALHHAANENHQAIVTLLLNNKCSIEQNTAIFEFQCEKQLLARSEQQLDQLYQEKNGLNNQLLMFSIQQDLKIYDQLKLSRNQIETEINKIKDEENIIQSRVDICASGIFDYEKKRNAYTLRRNIDQSQYDMKRLEIETYMKRLEIAKKESNTISQIDEPNLKHLKLSLNSVLIAGLSQKIDDSQQEMNIMKQIDMHYSKYLTEELMQNYNLQNYNFLCQKYSIYSPYLSVGEPCNEEMSLRQEKESFEKQLIPLKERLIYLEEFLTNKKMQFLEQCLKDKYLIITTKLITAGIIDCNFQSIEKQEFDIETLREVINQKCKDINDKRILKKQLVAVEEQILQIHSDLEYFKSFKVLQCKPLLLAAYKGNTDTVKLLLDRKANLFKIDVHQSTVLHWATRSGQSDLIELLLKYNIDVNIRNEFGNTALDIARAFGHSACVKLIEDHIQDQKTFQQLEKYLQPLRDEIQSLRLQVQQLTHVKENQLQPKPIIHNTNPDEDRPQKISDYNKITFLKSEDNQTTNATDNKEKESKINKTSCQFQHK